MSQEYISTSNCAVMNMASLFSNPAASTVENSINVKIVSSETAENPADTELETSLESKPSAWEGRIFGSARICLFWHRRMLQDNKK